MSKSCLIPAGFSLIMVFSLGCASIVSKSVCPVTITSEPSNADLTVFNHGGKAIFQGKTPATIDLKAGRGYFKPGDYRVSISKTGYQAADLPIKQGINGWYAFGNILIGGLVGWIIVDPITGAMWTVEDLNVTLQPASALGTTQPAEKQVLALPQSPSTIAK